MNDKKAIALFMRFMKQNRAWAAFKINIKDWSLQGGMAPRPYKTHGCVNVPLYLKECPSEFYVSNSFSWGLSPQEYWYWPIINNKWKEQET